MTGNRLNDLALLHVYREIDRDVEEVINRFAVRHPRRMKLIDILNIRIRLYKYGLYIMTLTIVEFTCAAVSR